MASQAKARDRRRSLGTDESSALELAVPGMGKPYSLANGSLCCHFVLMVVETLGDAFSAGWRITARCAWGKREGMKTRRECHYTRELDLETLVWTRGPNFPLSSLDGRLMSRAVVVDVWWSCFIRQLFPNQQRDD